MHKLNLSAIRVEEHRRRASINYIHSSSITVIFFIERTLSPSLPPLLFLVQVLSFLKGWFPQTIACLIMASNNLLRPRPSWNKGERHRSILSGAKVAYISKCAVSVWEKHSLPSESKLSAPSSGSPWPHILSFSLSPLSHVWAIWNEFCAHGILFEIAESNSSVKIQVY